MPDQETTIQQTSTEATATADVTAHDTPTHETAASASATSVPAAPAPAASVPAAPAPAVPAPAAPAPDPETLMAYESIAEDPRDWDEPIEDLPRRPRRRLLGTGGNPIILALLGVLLIACGFIGGVLVEKGQTSSSSSSGAAAGLASRFAALRGASGTGSSTTGGSGTSSTGRAFGGSSGSGAGFSRPTAGTVAYLAGSTLYVTNSEDNTVKVKTSAGTSVTKTVKSTVKDIHPGETVTVTGATGSNGAISAESVSVGSTAGGLAALFGGSGAGGRGSGAGAGSGGAGSDGPALFGSGG